MTNQSTTPLVRMAFFCIVLAGLEGCHALSKTGQSKKHGPFVVNKFPLTFKDHNFSAYCFSTRGCRVFYNGRYDVHDSEEEISRPLMGDAHLQDLYAVRIGIQSFPEPALVAWRSKDGSYHEAKVDLDEIFKKRRVVHDVDEKEILKDAAVLDPDIILVVDDRTISVYMKAYIPLKHPENPANKYSNARDELVLAYRQLY
ncbi:hypothetical protein FHW69_003800 [Luteibacter sp. Sphag1AF]|uniref:hypothetical protein n=1 Tax=Luteibacter sp. Sphag1AF TaxID=2587031 RepID=UPI001621F702|nr:hypothetical protein [Luteibacter sp. Sphag1AF]MBB3229148.1 hypothetical protein [Luteibacter sp. Sphag1AF]